MKKPILKSYALLPIGLVLLSLGLVLSNSYGSSLSEGGANSNGDSQPSRHLIPAEPLTNKIPTGTAQANANYNVKDGGQPCSNGYWVSASRVTSGSNPCSALLTEATQFTNDIGCWTPTTGNIGSNNPPVATANNDGYCCTYAINANANCTSLSVDTGPSIPIQPGHTINIYPNFSPYDENGTPLCGGVPNALCCTTFVNAQNDILQYKPDTNGKCNCSNASDPNCNGGHYDPKNCLVLSVPQNKTVLDPRIISGVTQCSNGQIVPLGCGGNPPGSGPACSGLTPCCLNNSCVTSCPSGCTPVHGANTCGTDNCGNAYNNCNSGYSCNSGNCVCTPSQPANTCGTDNCGNSYNNCNSGYTCSGGTCSCTPSHPANTCGTDNCGNSYNNCNSGYSCSGNNCVCTPSHPANTCGTDNCGNAYNNCSSGFVCSGGSCVCAPNCTGKSCGNDGCGGSCGTCPGSETCNGSGQCVCTPNCAGLSCGNDGCGGSCGTCSGNDTCQSGNCVCQGSCGGKACGSDDGCGNTCTPGSGCSDTSTGTGSGTGGGGTS